MFPQLNFFIIIMFAVYRHLIINFVSPLLKKKCCSSFSKMRLKLKRLTLILILSLITILLVTITDDSVFEVKFKPNTSNQRNVKTCGRYPRENDILRDNSFWQVSKTPKGLMKLFNAYLDTRMNKTMVRVTIMAAETSFPNDTIFCQFWFKNVEAPYVVKASEALLLWQRGEFSLVLYKSLILTSCIF